MIQFESVTKYFGGQSVLVDASFRVETGERVGVVGPNGSGKSTILNLVSGELTPDRGAVSVPRNARLGYLRQQLNPRQIDSSILEYAENAVPELTAIQRELDRLDGALHAGAVPDRGRALLRLAELQDRYGQLGGYDLRHRAEASLCGLGFDARSLDQPFRSQSGGWQLRAELARVLTAEPEILLLDEPSNYLDIPAVEWLQRFLRDFPGTLLLVSHDRYLLNTLTNVTLALGNGRVERCAGNYDASVRERAHRREQLEAARRSQQRRREQIESFVERFRAKNTKASQVQSRIKMLEKMEEIELPADAHSPGRIRLRPPPHCGVEVLRLESAGVSYDGSRWVLRGVDLRIERGDKIGIVGLNGLGKTTLLRLMAGHLPLSEGRCVLGHKVVVGYQSQESAETLDPSATVFRAVKSAASDVSDQEVRNLLGSFGFSGDAAEKPVAVLSGGEKSRVAFARLLVRPPNLLLLDEPTTHLDIPAREALQEALRNYKGAVCLVSHDIECVRAVATSIVAMEPPRIGRYIGSYDYYREKFAATGAAAPKRDPAPSSPPVSDPRALRRERAMKRAETAPQRRRLRGEVEEAEAEIDRLEAEQAELLAQLHPDTPGPAAARISRRLGEIHTRIEETTRRWEYAAAELELLQIEPAGGTDTV